MLPQATFKLSRSTLLLLTAFPLPLWAADNLAPWLQQMGETSAILSAANWGKNQTIGIVDTGIALNNSLFAAGQISVATSACAGISFSCAGGVADGNGHGTAVAGMAAANTKTAYAISYSGYSIAAGSYLGVAPNANIVAEKALSNAGSGSSADVTNGINKAVAAGASVINLSLTYIPSADIVAAVNAGAAKGVFFVWAAGNSNLAINNGANSYGFTADAIKRLLLVGALDTNGSTKASYSNTAGSGKLVATNGSSVSYASRVIYAPGTNILGALPTYGSTALGLWSGTSMAAPMISGSLALLESAWPILRTNGSAANLLLATTTDLGNKGVDSVYGSGGVNLGTAFKPYGTLSVTQANGKAVALPSINATLINSGAFGSLSSIKNLLSNYQAFDTYQRNFTVNLSGLIQSKPTAATLNPLPTNTNTGVTKIKLSDGGEIQSWLAPTTSALDRIGPHWNESAQPATAIGYVTYSGLGGNSLAMGYGAPARFSYAHALHGDEHLARMSGELGASPAADLLPSGHHLAYGMPIDQQTRVAVALSRSMNNNFSSNPWFIPPASSSAYTANNVHIGLAHRLNGSITLGASIGQISERSGLLGSNYQNDGLLDLGNHLTRTVNFSAGYHASTHTTLLAEAGLGFTRGGPSNGLISQTSQLVSQTWGVSLQTRQLLNPLDKLTLSLKQPLRISSGTATVLLPGVDEAGLPTMNSQRAGLVPDGREINLRLAYETTVSKNHGLIFQVSARKDANNIAGQNDTAAGVLWTTRF